MNSLCPVCEASVPVQKGTEQGELILCPDCGAELEVSEISSDQTVLIEAPEEEEDWGQ